MLIFVLAATAVKGDNSMNDSRHDLMLNEVGLDDKDLPFISKAAGYGYDDYDAYLSVTSELRTIAEALSTAVRAVSRLDVTADSIEAMLMYLIWLRGRQLSNSLPRDVRAAQVTVPNFLLPFLKAIANYDDPMTATRINVSPDPGCGEGWTAEDHFLGHDVSELAAQYRMAIDVLRSVGLKTSRGLPRELTTNGDNIFRIRMDEDGSLLIAGSEVGGVDLLVRSIINITFQPEVWGEARTRYVNVGDYHDAFYTIVRKALS